MKKRMNVLISEQIEIVEHMDYADSVWKWLYENGYHVTRSGPYRSPTKKFKLVGVKSLRRTTRTIEI